MNIVHHVLFCISVMVCQIVFSMEIVQSPKKRMVDFFQKDMSCSGDTKLKKIFNDYKQPHIEQWWYLDRVLECGSPVNCVSFGPGGKRVAAGLKDGKVRVFDFTPPKDPRCIYLGCQQHRMFDGFYTFKGACAISSLAFHPSEELILTGPESCHFHMLDLRKDVQSKIRHDYSATLSASFDSSGNRFVVAAEDGWVRIFNLGDRHEHWCFKSKGCVNSVCFDPTGKYLAIGGSSDLCVVDLKENKRKDFKRDFGSYLVCFDTTGKYLAIGSGFQVRIFDVETQDELMFFNCKQVISSISFDPTGKYLAIGSGSKARIFDRETQKGFIVFNDRYSVRSICFDSTGERLAIGSNDGIARILSWFKDQTLHQIMLKKIMMLWFQVKKPNKAVTNIDQLFADIRQLFVIKDEKSAAVLFQLNEEELQSAWKTFPQNMQQAIWKTIAERIDKYGK